MYYCQISVPFELINQFKKVCLEIKAQYDFDTRQKRWEAKLQNSKATKKNIQKLKDFAVTHSLKIHDWYAKTNQYKDSVYYRKGAKK